MKTRSEPKGVLCAAIILAVCFCVPPAFSDDLSNGRIQRVALVQSQQQDAANELQKADTPADIGPADICLEQVKGIMCPIFGQMPFFRDMLGQMAVWGGFSCPMGQTVSNIPTN